MLRENCKRAKNVTKLISTYFLNLQSITSCRNKQKGERYIVYAKATYSLDAVSVQCFNTHSIHTYTKTTDYYR